MQFNWRDIAHYLSAPGTGDTMNYANGCFVTAGGNRSFSVHGHIVDFIG